MSKDTDTCEDAALFDGLKLVERRVDEAERTLWTAATRTDCTEYQQDIETLIEIVWTIQQDIAALRTDLEE